MNIMALACSKPPMALHCILCYFLDILASEQEQCNAGVSGTPELILEQSREQEESLFALPTPMTIQGPPGEVGRGPLAAGAKTRQQLCSESTMAGCPAQTQLPWLPPKQGKGVVARASTLLCSKSRLWGLSNCRGRLVGRGMASVKSLGKEL